MGMIGYSSEEAAFHFRQRYMEGGREVKTESKVRNSKETRLSTRVPVGRKVRSFLGTMQ